ncbi:hypothetical protein KAT63_04885 [Candidatus Parcubacteria bacterium]|nr:hypothetical protein [Candidatus Parcubacteria bacterium]
MENLLKKGAEGQITEEPKEIKTEKWEENKEKERTAKIDLIKETLETHFPKIIGMAEFVLSKKEISISDENKEKFRNLLIGTDEVAIKILKIGSSDKRIEAVSGVLTPLLEKEIKIKERENEGEKISKQQKIKEKLRVVVPDDSEKDKEYMKKLADLLGNLEMAADGRVKIILMALNKILRNDKIQEKVSNDFREWMNEDETEENAANADDEINIENIEEEIEKIAEEFDLDNINIAKKF